MRSWKRPSATCSVVRPGKETLAVAVPGGQPSGTRTGPEKFVPQQRWSSVNVTTLPGVPGAGPGKVTSTTGLMAWGTRP